MEKRSVFGNKLLPYVLLAPQLAITLVFFYWPASQAAWTSFRLEDAFGTSSDFVGFENYQILLSDKGYYGAIGNTAVFSAFVAGTVAVTGAAARRDGGQADRAAARPTAPC